MTTIREQVPELHDARALRLELLAMGELLRQRTAERDQARAVVKTLREEVERLWAEKRQGVWP